MYRGVDVHFCWELKRSSQSVLQFHRVHILPAPEHEFSCTPSRTPVNIAQFRRSISVPCTRSWRRMRLGMLHEPWAVICKSENGPLTRQFMTGTLSEIRAPYCTDETGMQCIRCTMVRPCAMRYEVPMKRSTFPTRYRCSTASLRVHMWVLEHGSCPAVSKLLPTNRMFPMKLRYSIFHRTIPRPQ